MKYRFGQSLLRCNGSILLALRAGVRDTPLALLGVVECDVIIPPAFVVICSTTGASLILGMMTAAVADSQI